MKGTEKSEENERWTEIAKNAKTVGQIWKMVNRERQKKGR